MEALKLIYKTEILKQLSVLCHIKQGDSIRTYVASGTVVIGGVDEFPYLDPLLDLFHDIKGILIGISMSDTDDLLFGTNDGFTDKGNQCI